MRYRGCVGDSSQSDRRDTTEPLMPSLASTLDTEVVRTPAPGQGPITGPGTTAGLGATTPAPITGPGTTAELGATTPAPDVITGGRHRQTGVLEENTVLAGRYRIERRLGGGGMGEVYLAEHTTIGKLVAIKILNAELAHRPALVERFLIEARSASMVRHDNVVDITDFGHLDDGTPFFVMAYLQGEDLRAKINSRGRLPWAETKPLVLQILAALQAAHDAGVIHRDMKPDNCFCLPRKDDDGASLGEQVKVMDFGIAKVVTDGHDHELTQTGVVIGTASYMSPEQAQSLELDHRTDIYSVGVILYQMLTGSVPFKATGFMGVLSKHITDPPEPPHERCPEADISPQLEAVILRALAKKPDDRPASARAFAEELRAQPDVQLWSTPQRPLRKVALAVGGLAVLALVGAWVGPKLAGGAQPPSATADPFEDDDDDGPLAMAGDAQARFPEAGTQTEEGLVAMKAEPPESDPNEPNPSLGDPAETEIEAPDPDPEPDPDPVPRDTSSKKAPKKTPKKNPTPSKTPNPKSGGAGGSAPLDDLVGGKPSPAPRDMQQPGRDLAAAAKTCGARHGGLPGVSAKVRLSVGPSGDAKAQVLKPLAGTPLARCIEDAMSKHDYGEGQARTVTVAASVG